MPRRSYLGKAAETAKSVAGTLGEGARSAKETVRTTLERRRARRELEEYRSEETRDQEQARIERAEQEARREAQREARQEFVEEYRDAIREQAREEELEEIRQRQGFVETDEGELVRREQVERQRGPRMPMLGAPPADDGDGDQDVRFPRVGPPPADADTAAPSLPQMGGPMAAEGTQPGFPGVGPMDTDGDGRTDDRDQPYLPFM